MLARATLIALALGAGCKDGSSYSIAGNDMSDHFPLDGERTWVYANEASEDLKINVEKSATPEMRDDIAIYTLEYFDDRNGDLLWTFRWSSDSIYGVQLWGYEVIAEPEAGGDTGDTGDTGGARGPAESMTFDPPVQLADRYMATGESTETEVNGTLWTSTYEAQEECENLWVSGENTWTCLRVSLDDGDGDPDAGAKAAGTFWLAPRYGMSWFQLPGDPGKWILASAEWEAAGS